MAKNTVTLEFENKEYEVRATRFLQCKYNEIMNEKKRDTNFQIKYAEAEKAKANFEKIAAKYQEAQDNYLNDPLDEEKEKVAQKMEQIYTNAFNSYSAVITENNSQAEMERFILNSMEGLLVEALEEQHKMTKEEAEEVWGTYVDENGDMGAQLFLYDFANTFIGDIDENPHLKRIQQRNNRLRNGKRN